MGRTNFENELKQLHIELISMGSFVETAIEESIKAFKNNDIDLCKTIINKDKDVDEMEKHIESKCLWLIAREQPIASDLRKITAALKIITDMEKSLTECLRLLYGTIMKKRCSYPATGLARSRCFTQ